MSGVKNNVFLSMSFRVKANVEALNAVETLGNIIRHRKATVIVKRSDKFEIMTVPAISGEALRHGYQAWLADLASISGISVCTFCKQHEFIKHGVRSLIEREVSECLDKSKDIVEKELCVIKACVVEDVGGFLMPLEQPVKRTSRIQFSYMLPALEDRASVIDLQFHVRNAPLAQALRKEGREEAQMIYNIESASAVYTFTVNLDVSGIGKTSNCLRESGKAIDFQCGRLDDNERIKRIEIAIKALAEMVKTGAFGGKRSSYLPDWRVLSCIALISSPIPTTVYPGHLRDYALRTVELAKKNKGLLEGGYTKLKYEYAIIGFVDEKEEIDDVRKSFEKAGEIEICKSIGEFFERVITKTLNFIKS